LNKLACEPSADSICKFFSGLVRGKKAWFWFFFIIFILYFQTIFFSFSPMDDPGLIEKRMSLLQNWGHAKDIFTYRLDMAKTALLYRPILELTFMIDATLGKGSPWMFHLSNVVIFFISMILIFNLYIALKIPRVTAFACTIILMVHPLNVSVASWIPARNDSLLAIMLIGTLLSYFAYLRNYSSWWLGIHYLMFGLSLFTKENAVVIPFIILAYHGLAFRRKVPGIKLKAGIWGMIMLFWVWMRHSPQGDFIQLPIRDNIIYNTISTLNFYIGKFFYPVHPSVMPNLQDTNMIPIIVTVTIFLGVLIFMKKRDSGLALWGLVFFISVLIIPLLWGTVLGLSVPYEHRMFIPAVGLIISMTQLEIPRYFLRFRYHLMILVILLIVLLGTKTYFRAKVFENKNTYSFTAVSESPSLWQVYAIRADALTTQNYLFSAAEYYSKAIDLIPLIDKHELYYARGNCYQKMGYAEAALEDYGKYISQHPDFKDVYINRAIIYRDHQDYQSAIADLTIAISLDSNDAVLFNERGFCFQKLKEYLQSIEDFNVGLALNPENKNIINNRSVSYFMMGECESAKAGITLIESLEGSVHPDFKRTVYEKCQ